MELAWTEFKNYSTQYGLSIQYVVVGLNYAMTIVYGNIHYQCHIPIDPTHSDTIDFVTNYQSSGNKNTLDIINSTSTIVDEVSSSLLYVGTAISGSLSSSAVWKIKKILTSGGLTTIQYADGETLYDNIWDDRASLTYL